jgi:phosphotransferase system enzyme I (PtsI)
MILDGRTGTVILRPDTEEQEHYRHMHQDWLITKQQLAGLRHLPATTLDGHRVTLLANIELPEEAEHVHEQGAEGIGLFRTEFIYLNRETLPSEDEQYQVYARVYRALEPQTVVFRTLDLGGDKFLSKTPIEELNPFLGLRALRLCMENPEVFRAQLRAMFKAGAGKKLHILFPMVTGLEDFRAAKAFVEKIREELNTDGIPPPEELEIGIMIETPSAALTSNALAPEADFFSIGTNDLVQYTLAVDRVNKRVAYLYEPLHPAVLRLIETVVRNARAHQIPVAVCGEMAAEPSMAALLVGLGIRELSMGPVSIPAVKSLLRTVRAADLERLAGELLTLPTATQIRTRLEQRLGELQHISNSPRHGASAQLGGLG